MIELNRPTGSIFAICDFVDQIMNKENKTYEYLDITPDKIRILGVKEKLNENRK